MQGRTKLFTLENDCDAAQGVMQSGWAQNFIRLFCLKFCIDSVNTCTGVIVERKDL